MHGRGEAERKKLRSPDQVAVAQFLVAVFDHLEAEERRHQFLVRRQLGGRDPPGLGCVGIVLKAHAEGVAPDPAVDQALRPTAEDLGPVLTVAIFADHVAGVVEGIDAVVLGCRDAGRPTRVQRVERAHHRGCVTPAVAVLRQAVAQIGPGAERALVGNLELVAAAIDIGGAAEAHRYAGPEQVVFLDADPARVRSACATGADARVERPGVPCLHFDIDHAIAIGHRAELHVVEIAHAAQQAFALVDHPHGERVAALEQQRTFDDVGARSNVQRVGPAKQQLVFLWILCIEDFAVEDANLADLRPCGFELRERRKRLQRLLCRHRDRQRQTQPTGQASGQAK